MRLTERLAKRIQALESELSALRAQCEWLKCKVIQRSYDCPPAEFSERMCGSGASCAECRAIWLETEPWKGVKSDV